MLVFLGISGNCTTRLLEDLLKPSDRVRRCSLVIVMPTEADWNTGTKITIAALPEKKSALGKKYYLHQSFGSTAPRRRQFP